MSIKRIKKLWKRIFGNFEEGDRVVITFLQNGKYMGLRGVIMNRCIYKSCEYKLPHWAVRTKEGTFAFFEDEMELE